LRCGRGSKGDCGETDDRQAHSREQNFGKS
jgi:hypothetical protein